MQLVGGWKVAGMASGQQQQCQDYWLAGWLAEHDDLLFSLGHWLARWLTDYVMTFFCLVWSSAGWLAGRLSDDPFCHWMAGWLNTMAFFLWDIGWLVG